MDAELNKQAVRFLAGIIELSLQLLGIIYLVKNPVTLGSIVLYIIIVLWAVLFLYRRLFNRG